MKIKSLYFKNGYLGWEVKRIEFQNLNLLVGLSGAGKSQILHALWLLRDVALSGQGMNHIDWTLEFTIGEKRCEWKGSFGTANFEAHYKVKTESIQTSTGQKIERRADGCIRIIDPVLGQSQITPKSTTPEGLLFQIYSNYDFIAEIVEHFKRMNLRDHTQSQANSSTDAYRLRFRYDGRRISTPLDLAGLRNSPYNMAERLLIAYSKRKSSDLTIYDTIVSEMKTIFPFLEEWAVEEQVSQNNEAWNIAYKIKVKGQRHFILHRNIASGMLRTFNILTDLYLSHPETIFLLDEFENSLGHNCLPNLEELVMEQCFQSQFIFTSHHPDIINFIPAAYWILIERDNGAILNRPASQLPFFNSGHEPYLILTNHLDRPLKNNA